MTSVNIEAGKVQIDEGSTLFHRLLAVILQPMEGFQQGFVQFEPTIDALGQLCGYVLASAGPDHVEHLANRLLQMTQANMMTIRAQMEASGDVPEVFSSESSH